MSSLASVIDGASHSILSDILQQAGLDKVSVQRLVQVALAKCLGDGECLENLVCLNLCNNKKDESACQVRTCTPMITDSS